MDCEKQAAKKYYDKLKNNDDFKQKNRNRANAYREKNLEQIRLKRDTDEYRKRKAKWELNRYHKNKDEVSEKMKLKRQTPEYKAMMKAYREKNKEKIAQQEVITKKRYQDKHRDSVTDRYCIAKIKEQFKVPEELIPPEMIEEKRIKILIKRLRNNIADSKRKLKNEKHNIS